MRPSADLVFKSLADPTRRLLFEQLSRDRGATVRRLTERAGVSQPAVSKHLRLLREAGLVRGEHQGRETRYTANARGLTPLFGWLEYHSAFWEERFDRLDALLKKME
ncbi:MAG: ArsR/SmtB family transcription factor [Opitutaceae bacterium]